MDAYFPIISKQPSRCKTGNVSTSDKTIAHPRSGLAAGVLPNDNKKRPIIRATHQDSTPSSSEITKKLLSTLTDVSNPITHSDISTRSDHVVAFATGHQISEERKNQRLYMNERKAKLSVQRESIRSSSELEILKGCRIYINGYLESTTDIELKRLVFQAGGQIVGTASQCTHIVTSRGLSGSKTHQFLTQKTRNTKQVVKPEWVVDSIAAGKRRPERLYSVIKDMGLQQFLQS
ncbi:BRCT domain-containing protein [Crassisporium funariophilum]|nr:BRCT domain-containing protein [Crassisporium funariophilum]